MEWTAIPRAAYKVASREFTKWKRKKQFNWEHIIKPLIGEVKRASEGDFPGNYGERETEWDEIGEEVRLNMPNDLVKIGDDYSKLIHKLSSKEQTRETVGAQFINRLPGGKKENNEFRLILGIEEVRGPTDIPREDPILGDLDEFLQHIRPVLESSETPSELKKEVRSIARQHESNFEEGAIEYWRNDLSDPEWADRLLKLYETGSLEAYYDTIDQINKYKEEIISTAREMNKELEKLN
jgi:hypothetical protein